MNKGKILLVDNDPDFLRTRQRILESEGYKVITASGPDEAAEILKNDQIGLAVVDLRLRDDKDEADMSGLALIKSVAPQTPKILLTGYPTVGIARRALRGYLDGTPEAVDLLSKEESVDTFLRAVAHAIQKKFSPNSRKKFWIISSIILTLVVSVSSVLVFWLDKGIMEVVITVFLALGIELIAALSTKAFLVK